MAKGKIFISHTSSEDELAALLKQRLLDDFNHALDIFVSSDQATIIAGERWLDKVSAALQEAQLVLILCSSESIRRPWVNFEAGAGWIRKIPILPVCHSGLAPADLPLPLSLLQSVTASQPEGLRQIYAGIAKVLDWKSPEPDFDALAAEIKDLEAGYALSTSIRNPRVLCAASTPYADAAYGFDLDVAVLEAKFPGCVVVRRDLTARSLRDLLFEEHFDIVHLVLAVDPTNGDLVFSPVDSWSMPQSSTPDRMPAVGFSNLLAESGSSLVVLATCNALLLAVEVAHAATMVATDVQISGSKASEWADWFYDFLVKGKSVYEAHALTQTYSDAPMRLIRHQDATFTVTPPES